MILRTTKAASLHSMQIKVSKYHGTGNDHILVDDRDGALEDLSNEKIKMLCDRKFGIGSDGLILVRDHAEQDLEMIFYNPDASQSFCGNGSRCLMAFCEMEGIVSEEFSFHAIDGSHEGRKEGTEYAIHMHDIPFSKIEEIGNDIFLDTGSPHYVVFVDDLEGIDIIKEAHKIRYNDRFREAGTNVNFVVMGEGQASVRTYERGVEDETLSCGTGVTAVALAVAYKGRANNECRIHTKGGELKVRFQKDDIGFNNIWMVGPAVHVFDATIEI